MQHDGHRQRLRERFAMAQLDAFHPHEVLELLLTYAIPRRDTNPIAHNLMDYFGSLHAVLEATPEELMKVNGIGNHAATLISMLLPLYRKYEESRLTEKQTLNNYKKLFEYCISLFRGKENECIYVLSLNSQLELISADLVAEGSPGKVQINLRNIVALVLRRNASGIVISHNHPGGSPIPSQEDVDVTGEISKALSALDVKLLDHILVCGNTTVSFKVQNLLQHENMPLGPYHSCK